MLKILGINPIYEKINQYLDDNGKRRLAQSHPVLWRQGTYIIHIRLWHDQISSRVLREINDIARHRKVALDLSHLRDVDVSSLTDLYELDLSCCWGVMGISKLSSLHKLDLSYCEKIDNLTSIVDMKGLILPFNGKNQKERMNTDIAVNPKYDDGTRKGITWSIYLNLFIGNWCGYIDISNLSEEMRDNIERYTHYGITYENENRIGFDCAHYWDYNSIIDKGVYRSHDYVKRKLFAMIDYYVTHN